MCADYVTRHNMGDPAYQQDFDDYLMVIVPCIDCPAYTELLPSTLAVHVYTPGVLKRRRENCWGVSPVTFPVAPPEVDAGVSVVAAFGWSNVKVIGTGPIASGNAFRNVSRAPGASVTYRLNSGIPPTTIPVFIGRMFTFAVNGYVRVYSTLS